MDKLKENQLVLMQRKITPLIEQSKDIEIKNSTDLNVAVTVLSLLNKKLDEITTERERVTKPLNEALKAERSRWKPFEIVLEEAIDYLRGKMSRYQTEKKRLADEEEARIAARVGEGKGHLKPETAVRQMEEVDRPAGAVTAESGMVKFKTVKMFEVIDLSLVPIDYHLANETMIRKAMNADIEIAGVRYWTEQRPDNYR